MKHYRREAEPSPVANSIILTDRVHKAVQEVYKIRQKNGRLYDGDFCRVALKYSLKVETIKTISTLQSQEEIQFKNSNPIVW
jgi:hypothetical protein